MRVMMQVNLQLLVAFVLCSALDAQGTAGNVLA